MRAAATSAQTKAKKELSQSFGVQTQCSLLETLLGSNGKRATAVSLAMCAAALATAQGTRVLLAMLQALPLQDFYKVLKDPDRCSGRLSLPAKLVAMQRLAFQPAALAPSTNMAAAVQEVCLCLAQQAPMCRLPEDLSQEEVSLAHPACSTYCTDPPARCSQQGCCCCGPR